MKTTVIIGSGFSSLASACYMAKAGLQSDGFRKNEQLGGRASMMEIDGYKFDMVGLVLDARYFREIFADFGKKFQIIMS